MIITSVKIRRPENVTSKLVGICSITLDDMIAVHDIKILSANEGSFLAMPSRKTPSNTFKDIVHPINKPAREKIESIVLGLFDETEKENHASQEFKYIRTDCTSLLEQEIEDFETIEIKSHDSFINESLRKEISSWK